MNPEIPGNPMMERNDNSSSRVLLHILVALAIFIGTFLAIAGAAGAFCFFTPRQYYSKATMEVKEGSGSFRLYPEDSPMSRNPNRQLTVFQRLRSKEVLYPVIDNLELVKAWNEKGKGRFFSKEQVYYNLIGQMELSTIRNTDLIQIGVYSADKLEAVNIANMIAVVYKDVRENDQMQLREAALAGLKQEVANLRKDVEAAQMELQKIRERDSDPDSMDLVSIGNSEYEKLYKDAQAKNTELKGQLAILDQLKPDTLVTALMTLQIQDPTIAKILPQFQEAVSEEARLLNKEGIGENDFRIKALRAQKEVFSKQLTEAIKSLESALAIRVKLSEENLEALKKKREEKKTNDNDTTAKAADYINVKERYIKAKKVLEKAEMRLATERVQLQMSPPPYKIWEKAEPATYPSKPNVVFIMTVALMAGAFLGLVMAGIYLFFALRPKVKASPSGT